MSTSTRAWTDPDGDLLTVSPSLAGSDYAAIVHANLGASLTSTECREVAAHLTAIADEHDGVPTPAVDVVAASEPVVLSAHEQLAASLLSRSDAWSYGDRSGSTEAHTAATAYAVQAQTHATLALVEAVRDLRAAIGGRS